jgi:hypothetical protein
MISAERQSIPDRFGWLVDWLYPPRCRACGERIHGEDAAYFCASCRDHIELVLHPLCSVCGQPYPDAAGDDHVCAVCLSRPPHFIQAQAWACYPREESTEHPLRRVIQRFKYGRKVSLGRPLGQLLGRGCHEFLNSCPIDLIIPVPLHPKRCVGAVSINRSCWRGRLADCITSRWMRLFFTATEKRRHKLNSAKMSDAGTCAAHFRSMLTNQ